MDWDQIESKWVAMTCRVQVNLNAVSAKAPAPAKRGPATEPRDAIATRDDHDAAAPRQRESSLA